MSKFVIIPRKTAERIFARYEKDLAALGSALELGAPKAERKPRKPRVGRPPQASPKPASMVAELAK